MKTTRHLLTLLAGLGVVIGRGSRAGQTRSTNSSSGAGAQGNGLHTRKARDLRPPAVRAHERFVHHGKPCDCRKEAP